MVTNIFKKVKIINKFVIIVSSLLINNAMDSDFNVNIMNEKFKQEDLKDLIVSSSYKRLCSKNVYIIHYFFPKCRKIDDLTVKKYLFYPERYYDFFSNIQIKRLDIRNLYLEDVQFNYFLNNSIIDEIIISKNNFIKNKLDYFNQNLAVAAKINKITVHWGEKSYSYINRYNENYDFLLKVILNNINKIDDNDSFEIMNCKLLKAKEKIINARKEFVDYVNKNKKFNIHKYNFIACPFYRYTLAGGQVFDNVICELQVIKHEDNGNLKYIEIGSVRTAGYFSGCGLFKSLLAEIYKNYGLIPIVLNSPTTIGYEVYKKVGFTYGIYSFLKGIPVFKENTKKKLLDLVNNDCRILIYLLENIKDSIHNFKMYLLPIEQQIRDKFFKNDKETFDEIDKSMKINLDCYCNTDDIIYFYYSFYLKNSLLMSKYDIFSKLTHSLDKFYKSSDIEIDEDNFYRGLFTNAYSISCFLYYFRRILLFKMRLPNVKVLKNAFDKIYYHKSENYINKIFLNLSKKIDNVLDISSRGYFMKKLKNYESNIVNHYEINRIIKYNLCKFDDDEVDYFSECDRFITYYKICPKFNLYLNIEITDNILKNIENKLRSLFNDNIEKLFLVRKDRYTQYYNNLINKSIKDVMNKSKINNLNDLNMYWEKIKFQFNKNDKDKDIIKNVNDLLTDLSIIKVNYHKDFIIFFKKNDYYFPNFIFYYLHNKFFDISNKINSIIDDIDYVRFCNPNSFDYKLFDNNEETCKYFPK